MSGDDSYYLTDGKVNLAIRPWDMNKYRGHMAGLDHFGFKVDDLAQTKKDLDALAAYSPASAPRKIAIGREGDSVIIQGLAEPDKSFGGYPVITELAGSIARPGEVINFPDRGLSVYDERGAVADAESAAALQGVGTVTKVELAAIYAEEDVPEDQRASSR